MELNGGLSGTDDTLKNLYRGTADARSQFLAVLRHFDLNLARATHLDALRDVKCMARSGQAVFYEINAKGTRG